MVSLPLSLNKIIPPAILFNLLGTYVVALDIKSNYFSYIREQMPFKNKQEFLTLHIPNSSISHKPIIYQFGSHIHYLVGELAASTAFVHCNVIFATKAFNFDCPHTIYITTKVTTIVINAAMNRSTLTMKLSRNDPNLEPIWASSISFWFCLSVISFLICIVLENLSWFVGW